MYIFNISVGFLNFVAMARSQWKSKKLLILLLGIKTYLMIRVNNYEHKSSVFLSIHPNDAWEFVADFSNMKYLNPTITDFIITDESGNYKHWKYTTVYNENLSHWPYLPNYSTAQFEIRSIPEKEEYLIDSSHKTCLFNGYYCLNSISEFKFKKSSQGALCTETVIYECPRILSSFCRREVEYQREAIIFNLKKKFNHH